MKINDLKKVIVDISDSNNEDSDSSNLQIDLKDTKTNPLLPPQVSSILCRKLAKELDILKLDNLKIKKQNKDEKEKNSILRLNLGKINLIKENEIETINTKLEKSEKQNDENNQLIEKLRKQIENEKEKMFNYETMKSKLINAEIEIQKLKDNLAEVNALNKVLIKENKEKNEKIDCLNVEKEDYKKERIFLLNENFALKEKNERLNEQNENNKKSLTILQEEKEKIHNAYLSLEHEKEKETLEKLEKKDEIHNEIVKKEVSQTKTNLEILYESKIKFLTEEIENLKEKNEKIQKLNKQKTTNIDLITYETKNQIKILQEEISSLSLQLKIKEEDLNRMKTLYQNSNQLIEVLKKENSSLIEKNNVLKNEVLTQKQNSCEKLSLMKEEMSRLNEQNKNFAQIENEIEKIICDSSLLSVDENFGKILSEIPINNKRRVNQIILLCHRLRDFSSQITKLTNDNSLLQTELKKANEEKQVLININEKVKQPYEFLLLQMQGKDETIIKLNYQIEDLTKKIKCVMEHSKEIEAKKEELENDLKTILTNRKKIDNLEYIVKSYMEQQNMNMNQKHQK